MCCPIVNSPCPVHTGNPVEAGNMKSAESLTHDDTWF